MVKAKIVKVAKPVRDPALTPPERFFCAAYVKSGSIPSKARDVWLSTIGRYGSGSRRSDMLWHAQKSANALLARPNIQDEIQRMTERVQDELGFTAKDVLRQAALIAFGDRRELISHVRYNCRYCHGIDHKYQWTEPERDEEIARQIDVAAARKKKYKAPEFPGGVGYDDFMYAHPECPQCGGRGIPRVEIADTNQLSEAGAAIYEGVKVTRNGTEVLMASRTEALKMLSAFFGLTPETVRLMLPNGTKDAPLPDTEKLTPQQLAHAYQDFMNGTAK